MRHLLLTSLLLASTSVAAAPTELSQQGRLHDSSGAALSGTHEVTFTLYDAASTGNLIWSETHTLDFEEGYYQTTLGSSTPLDTTVFTGAKAFLAIAVGTSPELPTRIEVVSVPYAVRAEAATNVTGGVVDASELQINGTTVINTSGAFIGSSAGEGTLGSLSCVADEVAVWSGSDWVCGANESPNTTDASLLVQGVLDIARIPVGTSDSTVAAGNHGHELGDLSGTITSSQLPGDFADSVAAASGDKGNNNPLNHDRYTDDEAFSVTTAALGSHGDNNPLNHDRYTNDEAVAAVQSANYGVPPGAVMAFATQSCPAGWVTANGATVSSSDYPDLAQALSVSGNFTVPDLRGEFIRGADQGRGVDSGRNIGSAQAQDFKSFSVSNGEGPIYNYTHGAVTIPKSGQNGGRIFGGHWAAPSGILRFRFDSSEVRPRNVAMLYCIKS